MVRKRFHTFTVEGRRDPFPVDMLRSEECYPTDSLSVAAIENSLDPELRHRIIDKDICFVVNLSASNLPMGPDDKRWASFGWHVTSVNGLEPPKFYGRKAA